MRLETVIATTEQEWRLRDLPPLISLDDLMPGHEDWEVELGFGKGRFLLRSALENPERRFLGIELVSKYYRLLRDRARSHSASNLLVLRGEALYLLAAVLPAAFASRLHVYFPDPWPKSRHYRRRLFDSETLDLVLRVLKPGGELCFATDFTTYGQRVRELLEGHPALTVEPRHEPWPDGARTNYEAKYIEEGRPIVRLTARLQEQGSRLFHPDGRDGVLAATTVRVRPDD